MSFVILGVGCNSKPEKANTMSDKKDKTEKPASETDNTPKVTGVGGILFLFR